MSVKSDFIEALRMTPDGIAEFLTTPIPTPPAISQPSTTDDAIIAQGVLSYYFLEFFGAFAGVTPVELFLRIGQHDSVGEGMLLAGLEYLGESQTQRDFTVEEPVEGTTYAPGDVRVIVNAKNGKIAKVAVTVTTPSTSVVAAMGPVTENDNITFMGMARCEEIGSYTFHVVVTFADKTTGDATIACEVATQGEDTTNPEGEDLNAFNAALAILDKAYQDAIGAASQAEPVATSVIDAVSSAARSVVDAASAVVGAEATVVKAAIDIIAEKIRALYA